MKKKEEQKLTFDKLLMDEGFISDIIKFNDRKDELQNKYIKNKGITENELEQAIYVYNALSSHKRIKFSDEYKQHQSDRLMAHINTDEKGNKRKKELFYYISIAASVLIVFALSFSILYKTNLLNIISGNNQQIELIVPSGEKSQLVLADGTRVWLNSESRLKYPVSMKRKERKVFLEGEAYFDVTKQKGSHFIVYTQDLKVKVLGTKFNVKSYPRDKTIETTVVEGSVRIESKENTIKFSPVVLKPAERLVYRKVPLKNSIKHIAVNDKNEESKIVPFVDQEIIISNVNTDNITCWKDHLLVFDNETFEEIAIKMSRWYKVQIDILDADLKAQRYTGKFVNNESLKQVLEAIKLTTPIKYNINQNYIQITLNRK